MEHKSPARLPALKLIAVALLLGVFIYTTIVAGLLIAGSAPKSTGPGLFTILILATGLTMVPFCFAFGPIFAGAARQQWPTHRDDPRAGDWLLNQFASLTTIRFALVEAFGVLGATALLLTGQWAFIVAPLLAIGIMAIFMPTEGKARAFITNVTGQVPR
ncbi:MAG: hypothetical protein IT436_08040 [Phycisphaerales bacterium]|nr:hypothetical protein [Phycisphaerales bacterium]